jgi:endo-1,4-beta-xylanase
MIFITLSLCVFANCKSANYEAKSIKETSRGMSFPEVDQLKKNDNLPDLFTFFSGEKVVSIAAWLSRRNELKELLQFYEYGSMPSFPTNLEFNVLVDSILDKQNANFKLIQLAFGPQKSLILNLSVYIPIGTTKPPVIISGDKCWFDWGDSLLYSWPDKGLYMVDRGYALIEFNREWLQADEDNVLTGAKALYPACDWGNMAVWAWGFHRVVDYVIQSDLFDNKKIAVTGHSRGGKAALLAGAFDERIALVAPNGSGTCGSGPIRFSFDYTSEKKNPKSLVAQQLRSETIDDIISVFPYWFNKRFATFTEENFNRLPFDQDALIALVAPRAYLCTYAIEDAWANPRGSEIAFLSAKKVFTYLEADGNIAFHYREGGHEQTFDDWSALFDFADKVFYGKTTARKFDNFIYH